MAEPTIRDEWANGWVDMAHEALDESTAADAATKQKESEEEHDDQG
jgi:hypothetical protein